MKKEVLALLSAILLGVTTVTAVEQNCVFETSFTSSKEYGNPFMELEVDVLFSNGEQEWKVPAFWDGGNTWKVRFSAKDVGDYTYRVVASDASNDGLNSAKGTLTVTAYTGDNPLYQRGKLRVTGDRRYFEFSDGTPFLWLGDTWWKGLCKRISLDGFKELTADRKDKGFSVIHIVCGTYPDELGLLKPSWENEGGMPYLTQDFSEMNPEYFRYADQRIAHLVESGLTPAIVGGWGRAVNFNPVGLPGYKRHYRNLVARYGAYPVIWILGGETDKKQGAWYAGAEYLAELDPYDRLLCNHTSHLRGALEDHVVFDFDMSATGHNTWNTVNRVLGETRKSLSKTPLKPFVSGESCYELHMQQNPAYLQRNQFWALMLAGAAGHTYGAAGIWHMATPEEHGNWGGWNYQPYDLTTWNEGMHFPGSAQLGRAKALLETLPWQQFTEHPEWVGKNVFAAGIPGKIRVIYQPIRGVYKWNGITVRDLAPGTWSAFYFDPVSGRRYDLGLHNVSGTWTSPNVPSPQDWVLVMEAQNVEAPKAAELADSLEESFNGYEGTQNETQAGSGLNVAFGGSVQGWSHSGRGAMHAVDRSIGGGQVTPSDWAIMIFDDNVITSPWLNANDSGVAYRIDLEASPAVYANPEQATQAVDALRIEVLAKNDSVLKHFSHAPGAWKGDVDFTTVNFEYTGDGSGPVRLRIRADGDQNTGRFSGAIDNVVVRKK